MDLSDENYQKELDEQASIAKEKFGLGSFALIPKSIEGSDLEKETEIKQSLESALRFYKAVPVTDEEQLEQRILTYFATCYKYGDNPTIEGLRLALGWSKQKYEKVLAGDYTSYMQNMTNKARDIIQAYDADLLMRGKINVAGYIFRAKNYYGMVDKIEHTITNISPLDDVKSPEELLEFFPDEEIIEAETIDIKDVE